MLSEPATANSAGTFNLFARSAHAIAKRDRLVAYIPVSVRAFPAAKHTFAIWEGTKSAPAKNRGPVLPLLVKSSTVRPHLGQ